MVFDWRNIFFFFGMERVYYVGGGFSLRWEERCVCFKIGEIRNVFGSEVISDELS